MDRLFNSWDLLQTDPELPRPTGAAAISTENAIGPDDRGPAPAGNHPERDQLPVPFLFLEKA